MPISASIGTYVDAQGRPRSWADDRLSENLRLNDADLMRRGWTRDNAGQWVAPTSRVTGLPPLHSPSSYNQIRQALASNLPVPTGVPQPPVPQSPVPQNAFPQSTASGNPANPNIMRFFTPSPTSGNSPSIQSIMNRIGLFNQLNSKPSTYNPYQQTQPSIRPKTFMEHSDIGWPELPTYY